MNRTTIIRALLAGSAFAFSTAAFAQAPATTDQPAATQDAMPDASDAAADAAIAAAGSVDDAQAKIELLQAQVDALQSALENVKSAMVKTTPSWKGAPLFEDKDAGWSFKPRGRIQYDVGFTSNPGGLIPTRNLGFNTRARRIRLGAEGTIPGGFGYKFEMDYANSVVGFGDAILTYAPVGKPFSVSVGNHETFDGLEQITSSRFISFLERAQMNDAFINTRRLGISAGYVNKPGTFRLNAGLFAAHTIDAGFDNDGYIAAGRATFSPIVGGNQLHFGANVQYRKFQSNNGATASNSLNAPSTNQIARYRARPFAQTTDFRFVDTGNFAAKSDMIFGGEFAGVFKSLHVAAEAQYTKVNAYARGERLPAGLSQFATPTFLVASGDPSFFSAYGEVGYFLTGEKRGYKNGQWDRTKVLKPLSKGGSGALQINARYDYLDLDSNKLKHGFTNNFVTGVSTVSNSLTRGGKQTGYLASLIWIPEDYFRVLVNYAHAEIEGGPQAAVVKPTSTEPLDKRKYGIDTVAARVQIDF